MSDPQPKSTIRDRQAAIASELRRPKDEERSLVSAGGEPPQGGGGLEARVAKIEATLEHVPTKEQLGIGLADVRTGLAAVDGRIDILDERIKHLPSKGFIVSCILSLAALTVASTTFQDAIQKLFDLTP